MGAVFRQAGFVAGPKNNNISLFEYFWQTNVYAHAFVPPEDVLFLNGYQFFDFLNSLNLLPNNGSFSTFGGTDLVNKTKGVEIEFHTGKSLLLGWRAAAS